MKAALEPIAVFSDFDGTVTTKDTTVLLLELFGNPAWLDIEERMLAGEISEAEGMSAEFALINTSWEEAIGAILNEIHLDSTFPGFIAWLGEAGVPITILSGGVEEISRGLLKKHGIEELEVYANRLHVENNRWTLIPSDRPKIKGLCNHCKTFSVLESQQAGYRTVYIGDGFTDRCPAGKADIIFAKDDLAAYCELNSIEFHCFRDFTDIRIQLERLISHIRFDKKITGKDA
ncbi:MAG: MtnX-like HAD-IB family phosphatase [candidate division Zixibacteria bacterium]|nr:MtnX-like HAD-IB family phosphatase [Candidatus Tariuqbacter arcticus]